MYLKHYNRVSQVSISPVQAGAPDVNVYVNGIKINGTQILKYGSVNFPTTDYAALPAGDLNVEVRRNPTGSVTDSVLFAGKVTVADGKYYTIFAADTFPKIGAYVTTEDVQAQVDTFARIRVVHLLASATASRDTIEVIRKTDNLVVATGLTYGNASAFIPTRGGIQDTFFFRKVGSTTGYTGATAGSNGYFAAFTRGRTYTLFLRGVGGRATGTLAQKLDLYTNR